ncbi:DUF4040 family protein [Corynebacterium ulceribovis]|uniref:DUF4040 family protein n=1 Tax=Corynebacterium ulceribovis TaxID=487732 RepID=UPI0012EA2A85|nr:DUF4040 family protein [Corynebacterium ulceribovis]
MTLLSVPALVALALMLSPIAARILGRGAGWPIVAFFVAALVQLARLTPTASSAPATWEQRWFPLVIPGPLADSDIAISFAFRADPLSLGFAMLALGIGSAVFIYSTFYLPKRDGAVSFYVLMTTFMLAVVMLALANDIVLMFIAWELVSICSFLLIARAGSGGEAGAMRTLIITFFGGLLLLAAVAMTISLTGTTVLVDVLGSSQWAEHPEETTIIAALIALAAFTKAAQFPFHPWLPEAMAAATPVSAFLHAAAVVKAGVYVLLRFSTVFADNVVWQGLLICAGMFTAVMAALFALQQTDLKRLTAYSTVSQLGWIVATIGIGTPFALAAAVVHTLSHALFKSSLFMLVGVIDHETGTRNIRRIGSVWRQMPFTFGATVIGAASMAAVPPLFGFLSKEGMLTAFNTGGLSGMWTAVLLAVAFIGATLTFAYSARLVIGAFIDGDRDMSHVHEAPVPLWLSAALPALLSVPLVAVVAVLDKPVDAIVGAIAAESPQTHLALWHGINLELGLSLLAIAAGIGFIVARSVVDKAIEGRELLPTNGAKVLAAVERQASRLGAVLNKPTESLQPAQFLAPILWSIIALGGVVLWGVGTEQVIDGVPIAEKVANVDRWWDLAALAVAAVGVFGAVRSLTRLKAIIMVSISGVGVTLMILFLGAPDVALTQFMVEVLVTALMMLVVRRMSPEFPTPSKNQRIFAAVTAIAMGVVTFAAVWGLTGRTGRNEIGEWYLANTLDISGQPNIVNVILVEFRAFDTLGELTVLGFVGVAIAAVVSSIPRGQMEFVPVPMKQPMLGTLPLVQLMRIFGPILMIVSVLMFLRGHTQPGGGFNAALVASAGLALIYLASDRDEPVMPKFPPEWFIGAGVSLAVFSGVFGLAKGSFLMPLHGTVGPLEWNTALIFDLGVYFAVIGMFLTALNYLGGEGRPGTDKPLKPAQLPQLQEVEQ